MAEAETVQQVHTKLLLFLNENIPNGSQIYADLVLASSSFISPQDITLSNSASDIINWLSHRGKCSIGDYKKLKSLVAQATQKKEILDEIDAAQQKIKDMKDCTMSNRESKVGAAKAPLADLSEFDDCGLEADTDKTIVVEEGKHTAPALMLTSKGRICDMPTEPVSDKKSCSQQDETEVKKPVEHKAETERVRKKKPHVHKHNGAADMRGANYGTAAVVIGHVEGNVTTNIYHDGKHVHSNAGSRIHGEAEQRVLASQKQLTKYDLRKVTIGRRWRELAHELGFSDDELYFIREDFIREGMHEVVYQFLASWQERKSSEATLGVLAQAYAKIGKVSYLLELSKLFPG